jgi:arylsulfatase A-like enzyme/Tfp pilus assembly protein PilF
MRFPTLSAGVTVLLALLAASCGRKAGPVPPRPRNLLLVTIDTLRADRLGCYGYAQVETPNLDAVARRGTLFENAIAQAPLTAPSHASMMTGLYPTAHKVRDTGGFVLAGFPTLAEILQRQGFDTAAFVGASVLKKRFGFGQGFAVYDDEMPEPARGGEAQRRAGEVVDRALRWLEAQSAKPFFLWVHVYDPHLPYDPPPPFRENYKGRPYDGEVAYTDRELGRLFDAVAKKSPDTLTAVLSDHGEAFSEHGEYAHGVFLYDTTLRIAFLLAGPGVPAGLRVKQQARTTDLLPTVLEVMGLPAAPGVQGTTLTPAFNGKDLPATYSYVESLYPKLNMGWAELRGVRTNRWKYVRAPKPELYDLAQDPGETANVIAAHPAEVRELEAQLNAVAGSEEKIRTAASDARTMQQLRSLGYLGGSSQQEFQLTGKGIDPKDRTEVQRLLHFAAYAEGGAPLPKQLTMLRQAIALDSANPSLYSHLGEVYSRLDRPGEAMKLYQDAIKNGVRAAWLYSRLGQMYLKQGNRADAIIHFESAAQLNPYDYDSLENLAVAYRDSGRMSDAEGVLKLILQSGEDYAPAYNEMGMLCYMKGDRAAARTYFEKAAKLDASYHLNLARLYKMEGERAKARASFEAFLAARATSPEYRQVIPQVRRELEAVQ